MTGEAAKARARILKLLAKGRASCMQAASGDKILLESETGDRIAVASEQLTDLAREGLLRRHGAVVGLTAEGLSAARRQAGETDPFRSQHGDLEVALVDTAAGAQAALINLSESPLGQLVRRRNKTGDPFLTGGEFAAGERLRSDYTRGQIMPRLGANWEASVASSRRGTGGCGLSELTDAALAARQRVDMAIDAVGPELAGVLIDVCCFLKGLERVEVERGWPVRSAKIMLKTALGALVRHYNPGSANGRRSKVLHWGTADYRPKLEQG